MTFVIKLWFAFLADACNYVGHCLEDAAAALDDD